MTTSEAISTMRRCSHGLISRESAAEIVSAFNCSLPDLGLAAQVYGARDCCANHAGEPGFKVERVALALAVYLGALSAGPFAGSGKTADYRTARACTALEQHLAAAQPPLKLDLAGLAANAGMLDVDFTPELLAKIQAICNDAPGTGKLPRIMRAIAEARGEKRTFGVDEMRGIVFGRQSAIEPGRDNA